MEGVYSLGFFLIIKFKKSAKLSLKNNQDLLSLIADKMPKFIYLPVTSGIVELRRFFYRKYLHSFFRSY